MLFLWSKLYKQNYLLNIKYLFCMKSHRQKLFNEKINVQRVIFSQNLKNGFFEFATEIVVTCNCTVKQTKMYDILRLDWV